MTTPRRIESEPIQPYAVGNYEVYLLEYLEILLASRNENVE